MSHLIDSLAYSNRLRGLPPTQKVSFTLYLLGLSLLSSAMVQGLIGLWLAVWTVQYAGIPGRLYLRLLLLPIGFWLTSLPAFLINGVNTGQVQAIQWDVWQHRAIGIGSLYLYISQTGLHQVSHLLPRTLATTSCLYFMLLTVPFTEVLQVLRQWRCPVLLTELLLLMYRFIFSLLTIAQELWIAQNARGGYRTWKRGMQSLGILVGQLLQRTLDYYRQVSLGMASRGFNGTLRVEGFYPYCRSKRYALEALFGCTILSCFSLLLR